jgi:hypothetical protein
MKNKKTGWKYFGDFIIKIIVVYALLTVLICQVDFEIKISKKKTGLIHNITNIVDNAYSGYKSIVGSR